ncbi:MAG: glycosyltransferase family 4 protein [Cyclobacteriaceae bacterium]
MGKADPIIRPKRILVDISALAYENTGILSYTQGLLISIGQGQANSSDFVFEFVPSLDQISNFRWLERLKASRFKFLFHFFFFCWKQVLLPLSALMVKPDVLLVPDYVLPILKTAKLNIAVIHDAFLWDNPHLFGVYWRRYFAALVSHGLASKSIALTVSNYSKNALKTNLKSSIKIEVIHPFCLPMNFEETELSKDLAYFGITKNEYFLHAGLIDERKDLATLIHGFSIFCKKSKSNHKLVLTGKINNLDPEFIKISKIIVEQGIQSSVVFTDYVNRATLRILYSGASLYVFPSKDEGFGLPILEAWSFNVPVIVSDIGALKEVGGNAVAVFKAGDFKDLSEVMMSITNDSKRREDLILLGQKRCRKFNSKNFFTELKRVINFHLSQ